MPRVSKPSSPAARRSTCSSTRLCPSTLVRIGAHGAA
jgi:hypothetical protein